MSRDDVIVVSSVSCSYGIGSPEEYFNQRVMLFTGDQIERDDLLKRVIEIQYMRNDIDFHRGTFRVRGDVVEVFPAYEESQVVRIEFFDDVIDTISIVDPLRGKVLQTIGRVDIYPKSHYVVGKDKMKSAIEGIKLELRERIAELHEQNKLVEEQRLSQRTLLDLEMMEEMGFCSGIENYSRHMIGAAPGEPPYTLKGDRARKENLVNYGFRLPSALDIRPLKFKEFEGKLDQVLFVSATPANYELEQTGGEYVEQVIRPTGLLDPIVEFRDAKNQVDDMLVEARKVIAKGQRVLITTLTKKLAEELTSFYRGIGMRIRYLHSEIDTIERIEIIRDLRLGEFDILVGINLLREGLDIPEVGLVGILDADKEGFLRSTRSLIQIIGRAARNDEGRAILYGFKETPSMKVAMETTIERRKKQDQFNQLNGITPVTINKKVSAGVIEVLRGTKKTEKKKKSGKVDQVLSAQAIDDKIKELKLEMKQASSALEFEEAARIRDEIKKLTDLRFML